MATPNWWDSSWDSVQTGYDGESQTGIWGPGTDLFTPFHATPDNGEEAGAPENTAVIDKYKALPRVGISNIQATNPNTNMHTAQLADGRTVYITPLARAGYAGGWRPSNRGQPGSTTFENISDERDIDLTRGDAISADNKYIISTTAPTRTAPPANSDYGFMDFLGEVAPSFLAAFVGPQIAGALGTAGLSSGAAAAGSGAILGGGSAALTGGDIGRGALMGGATAAIGNGLFGGSTPSDLSGEVIPEFDYRAGGSNGMYDPSAISYPVETIATPQSFELPATPESGLSVADQIATGEQFANNVVPEGVSTDVPSVESVPDYGYDVPNDPYVAPDPVSPLSPPATPPPSGPATSSGIGGLNNSIYQPVLQSLTDFGVPWEVVQALPSVINSSLQGGALSSLTGGSFGTGAGMGAISSVLGNYLNSKGYNVPTSLLGAATSIIGSGLGLFDDGPSASGGNTRPNSGSPSGSSSGSTTINQQGGAILPFAPVANLMTAGRQVQAPNEFGGISAQLANITPYQSSPMSPLAYKDTPFQDYESILNATPAAHGGLMHLEDGGIAKQMAEISEKIKKITAPERKEVSQDALIKDYLNRQALSGSKQDFISPLSSKMMKGRGVKAQSFSGLPQEAAASPIPRMSATITPMNPLQNTANFIPSSRIPFAAHGGQIHPDLARVLEGRNVQMDREYVPGPEGRLYAKHDIRGFAVGGPGTGQSDDIPTMLSDGEYVIDADTVAALGDGSSKAGASVLDKFRQEIRKQKRSAPVNDIPPKAKSPMEYMKMARRSKP